MTEQIRGLRGDTSLPPYCLLETVVVVFYLQSDWGAD